MVMLSTSLNHEGCSGLLCIAALQRSITLQLAQLVRSNPPIPACLHTDVYALASQPNHTFTLTHQAHISMYLTSLQHPSAHWASLKLGEQPWLCHFSWWGP